MFEPTGYAKISTAAVRALARERHADFEVFIPGRNEGEDPVLYRRSDAGLLEPDFKRMAEHGVSALFVRVEDFAKCERAIEARLADILNNPNVAPGDKAEIVHCTGTTIAQDLIKDSVSSASLERTSMVVDNMIGCVLNDPIVAAYLLQMTGHERSTASHMFVVSTLAVMLGAAAFGPDHELLQSLGFAGMLHDLGKLSLAGEVLNKPTPLTREETLLVQQHPIESVRLIGDDPHVSQAARQMILQHHERVDGRGYPLGVSGAELTSGSRVLSIVDSFHAMIGLRAYRAPLLPPDANRVLATQAGRQFDADLLAIWQELFERYWTESAHVGKLEVCFEADEVSPRHEHRPTLPVPKIIQQRPTRFACKGNTMVLCSYAGRLINVSAAPDEFGALVHDVSRTGLCIYTAHPMYRGEIVQVQMRVDNEPVWLRSTVAWCRQQDANSYRIGLRFLKRVSETQANEPTSVLTMEDMADTATTTEKTKETNTPTIPKSVPRESTREKCTSAMATLIGIAAMRRPTAAAQRTVVTLAMSGDLQIRLKAVEVLMGVGTKMTREALTTLLHDANPEVRERAVIAVGTTRVTEATTTLRKLLRDPVESVALRAAGALGKLGDTRGLGLVERMLEADGPRARLAAQVVGEITGHRFSANREGVQAARRYLMAKKAVLRA